MSAWREDERHAQGVNKWIGPIASQLAVVIRPRSFHANPLELEKCRLTNDCSDMAITWKSLGRVSFAPTFVQEILLFVMLVQGYLKDSRRPAYGNR